MQSNQKAFHKAHGTGAMGAARPTEQALKGCVAGGGVPPPLAIRRVCFRAELREHGSGRFSGLRQFATEKIPEWNDGSAQYQRNRISTHR